MAKTCPRTFTITVSPGIAARLTRLATAHNERHGTALTTTAWLTLHLRELAVTEELHQHAQTIAEQAQTDANAAIEALRARLIAET